MIESDDGNQVVDASLHSDTAQLMVPVLTAIKDKSMDRHRILRAFDVAERCHRGQKRKSGEPYITHPVAVTTILAQLGMDEDTLVAALLKTPTTR